MTTPVSGPGQFSKRTDKAVGEANRSLNNPDYGEQATYKEQLAAAPLPGAQGQDVTGMNFNDLFGNAAGNVIPMDAESTMSGTPVTDGADAGDGADSSVLSSSQPQNNYMAAYMAPLMFLADQPGSSDAARNLLRVMKSKM